MMNNFERQESIDDLLAKYSPRELASILLCYHVAFDDVLCIMDESEGVAGLHFNGEVASWDWLLGDWLASVNDSLESHYEIGGCLEQTTS